MVTQKVTPINTAMVTPTLRAAALRAREERQSEQRKVELNLIGDQVATKLGVNIQRLHIAWDSLRVGQHPYVVIEGIILEADTIKHEPRLYARVTCPRCKHGSRVRTEINGLADLGDLIVMSCSECDYDGGSDE